MRTPDDAIRIRDYVEAERVKKAVVIGGGFIGLEVAENLLAQGVDVTVMDFASQIMPMCWILKWRITPNGICGSKGSVF